MAKICRKLHHGKTIADLISLGKAKEGDVLCDCKRPFKGNCADNICPFSEKIVGAAGQCTCGYARGTESYAHACDYYMNNDCQL